MITQTSNPTIAVVPSSHQGHKLQIQKISHASFVRLRCQDSWVWL